MQEYVSPSITELGSVQSMTLTYYNKVGPSADVYSASVPIVGSITPVS
jgi:hypothetical protein